MPSFKICTVFRITLVKNTQTQFLVCNQPTLSDETKKFTRLKYSLLEMNLVTVRGRCIHLENIKRMLYLIVGQKKSPFIMSFNGLLLLDL